MGNKGGAGVFLQYLDTRICFVNSHLAAHQEGLEDRRKDHRDIIKGLSAGLSTAKHLDVTHAFDYLFWLGDLNYRIDQDRADVLKGIAEKNYEELLARSLEAIRDMTRSGHRLLGRIPPPPPWGERPEKVAYPKTAAFFWPFLPNFFFSLWKNFLRGGSGSHGLDLLFAILDQHDP